MIILGPLMISKTMSFKRGGQSLRREMYYYQNGKRAMK